MKNIFSIDVEDWFHILELDSTPRISRWGELESHVERNLIAMLDEGRQRRRQGYLFRSRLGRGEISQPRTRSALSWS